MRYPLVKIEIKELQGEGYDKTVTISDGIFTIELGVNDNANDSKDRLEDPQWYLGYFAGQVETLMKYEEKLKERYEEWQENEYKQEPNVVFIGKRNKEPS